MSIKLEKKNTPPLIPLFLFWLQTDILYAHKLEPIANSFVKEKRLNWKFQAMVERNFEELFFLFIIVNGNFSLKTSSLNAWLVHNATLCSGYINQSKQATKNTTALTNPATAAVAVAIAGMILPAMRLVFSRSAGSMEYILALRADADATKSMWPLLSSSFSNCSGLICNRSTKAGPDSLINELLCFWNSWVHIRSASSQQFEHALWIGCLFFYWEATGIAVSHWNLKNYLWTHMELYRKQIPQVFSFKSSK